MLAELRGFGAGLVIVDQTPSVLVSSVIANTGSKLLHRLDHPDDRELAGRSAGLPADQVGILGTMRQGDVILRSDRRARPFRLRMPNPSVTYGAMPVPNLPEFEKPEIPTPCPICRKSGCVAERAGGSKPIKSRLAALQAVLRKGEEATWLWAVRELKNSAMDSLSAAAPLCFLIALGRAAELSESTLLRLRTTFESRIH